ncbi:MAG: anion transporter [Bdellovibrionales bacterium GWA1_52_35]|nr:MAG: anion transporter [Bdellovibrionales bacterium GWA1_52_35]
MNFWLSIALCGMTYFGLATGRWPGLKLDRATIALVGATALLVSGALGLTESIAAVNFETLLLLFGMMILVAFLRLSGFFERLGTWLFDTVIDPVAALALTVALSGVMSAFLVNDVICLAFTPLLIQLCRRLQLNPLPFLLALATAANIGSAGTIIGNPQNMIIGSLSQIAYARFAFKLFPPALLGLLADFVIIAYLYRGQLRSTHPALRQRAVVSEGLRSRMLGRVFNVALFTTLATVVLFFAGFPIALVALGAAAFLFLVLGQIRPARIYQEIDWGLLVMFTGLFVVVHAFEIHVIHRWNPESWTFLTTNPIGFLSLTSAVLSNLVSNVPAVLLFKPLMPIIPEVLREDAWLSLAMSSTFAGNLTVLGSVANLIVVESARRDGVHISFWNYFRVGFPVTLVTLAIGYGWLTWFHY